MTNKDKALVIVNKLFEICEQGFEISFSGHCREMVVGYRNGNNDGYHCHISDWKSFPDQLQEIIQATHDVEKLQKEKQ